MKCKTKAKEIAQKKEVKIGYHDSKKNKTTGCLFSAAKNKKRIANVDRNLDSEYEKLVEQLARTKKMLQELKEENERLMNNWLKK